METMEKPKIDYAYGETTWLQLAIKYADRPDYVNIEHKRNTLGGDYIREFIADMKTIRANALKQLLPHLPESGEKAWCELQVLKSIAPQLATGPNLGERYIPAEALLYHLIDHLPYRIEKP
jgi:hypothetical protein